MLKLVYSRNDLDPDNPSQNDGFIVTQLHGKIGKTFQHIVATRVPRAVHWQKISIFCNELGPKLHALGGHLDIRSAVKTQHLAITAYVPIITARSDFEAIVESFKDALRQAEIMAHPIVGRVESDMTTSENKE